MSFSNLIERITFSRMPISSVLFLTGKHIYSPNFPIHINEGMMLISLSDEHLKWSRGIGPTRVN